MFLVSLGRLLKSLARVYWKVPASLELSVVYGVRKWTKLPIPFRGVAAPLRGANHITVSSFLFRRGVVFSLRRVFVSSWRRVFVLSFLFRRGVVFSFCRFYFVVASCFRFVVFISSWGPVCFVLFVSSCRCDGT